MGIGCRGEYLIYIERLFTCVQFPSPCHVLQYFREFQTNSEWKFSEQNRKLQKGATESKRSVRINRRGCVICTLPGAESSHLPWTFKLSFNLVKQNPLF